MPRTTAKKTVRRTPPLTRDLAKLTNELASVQQRLFNRLDKVEALELEHGAAEMALYHRRCADPGHGRLVDVVLELLEQEELATAVRARLQEAVQHYDPAQLFEVAA